MTPNIEMPTQTPVTDRALSAQSTTGSAQSFSDSLLTASKASAAADHANDTRTKVAGGPRPASEDTNSTRSVSNHPVVQQAILPQQTVQDLSALQAQQAQLINPSIIPEQSLIDGPVVPANSPAVEAALPLLNIATARLAGNESTSSQPGFDLLTATKLNLAQSGIGLFQTGSLLPVAKYQGLSAPMESLSTAGKIASSAVPSTDSGAESDQAQGSTAKAAANTSADASAVPVQPPISSAAQDAIRGAIQSAVSNPVLNGMQNWTPNSSHDAVPSVDSNAPSTTSPMETAKFAVAGDKQATPAAAHDAGANTIENSFPDAVLQAVSNAFQNAEPTSALRAVLGASEIGVAAHTLRMPASDQPIPQPGISHANAPADPATVPQFDTGQAGTVIQLPAVLSATSQAGVARLNQVPITNSTATVAASGKDGSKGVTGAEAGPKTHSTPPSDQAGSQAGSGEGAPSGDQSQSIPAAHGQDAMPTLTNVPDHSATANSSNQNTAILPSVQNTPTFSGVAGHAAKTTDTSAPASTAVPQLLPVVNTARLIQTMGQSEMRVGMRSNEFGNISISTSATRDMISAQISVDHGELAKTLAAHLPEMQARLGGNQAMDVRIDMNGAGAGQGTGTSGSMSNGSADQSRGGNQQAGTPASDSSRKGLSAWQTPSVSGAIATGESRLGARLDIRV